MTTPPGSESLATTVEPRTAELAARVQQLLPVLAVRLLHFVKDFPVPDVTVAQAFLMHYLRQYGPCTASTIADLLGVTSGPVTSLTKRLIRHGLLDRRPDSQDGRVVWFSLTEAGVALADQLSRHSEERWASVIGQLGPQRGAEAVALMEDTMRVLSGLNRDRGVGSP